MLKINIVTIVGRVGGRTTTRLEQQQQQRLYSTTLDRLKTPPICYPSERRVVVTGLGVVSPLGVGVANVWERLLKGETGKIKHIQTFDLDCSVAGVVPEGNKPGQFNLSTLSKDEIKEQPRYGYFALVAAQEALEDSKVLPSIKNLDRFGVSVATCFGGVEESPIPKLFTTEKFLSNKNYNIEKFSNLIAMQGLHRRYKTEGPHHWAQKGCSTAETGIIDAFTSIKHGKADVMLAGGSDAALVTGYIKHFTETGGLNVYSNDEPQLAMQPFSVERSGFVLGEGAGILVLEEYESAKKRGAKIYAELRGYGNEIDPEEQLQTSYPKAFERHGIYGNLSMQKALHRAGLKAEDVDFISAHGISEHVVDSTENRMIEEVFGSHAKNLAISATKAATGHMLGGNAAESIFAIKAISTGQIPPTLNLTNQEPAFTLNYVPNTSQSKTVNVALKNAFGFGNISTTLVWARVPDS